MSEMLAPVLILSFRQRDELAALAARHGWRVVAARHGDRLASRLTASGAAVVVIDARGAVDDGLAAARALGPVVAREGRAMLALLAAADEAAIGRFYAAGATHFLLDPLREGAFAEALRFAARHAERVSGGWVDEERPSAPLGWTYDGAGRGLELTPALRRITGLGDGAGARAAMAWLGPDREAFGAALRRLHPGGTTAFAHDLPGVGRVVQHIQRDAQSGWLHAMIEPLGDAPDAGAAVRDVFPRRARSIAALARDLPQALAAGQIEVLFQPQVALASDRIIGVEALARWRHPRLGEIGAEALFAAAARAGRSVELATSLHRIALGTAAAWPAPLAGLRVAINVMAEEIAAPGFVAAMLALIDDSGLARDRVTLEIIEGDLIEDLERAATLLAQLRAAGCRTAIDDFGTGYSSLAYLNALPLDYLKLDKRLTRGMVGAPREQIVVRGVIAMARSLGLSVIAEGVESAAVRDLLATDSCDLYQGYLCAPPVDVAALTTIVGRFNGATAIGA